MTIVEDFRQHPQRVLDRLVDGELSESQRQALLAALDDEPGAWRACGLAFLEAQTWREQLPHLATEPSADVAPLAAKVGGPSQRRATPWASGLAIAAGLLVSFALGSQFAGGPKPINVAAQPSVTEPGATSPAWTEPASGKAEAHPLAPAVDSIAQAAPTGETPQVSASEPAGEDPWTTLTLESSDGASPDKQMQVRVRSDELAEGWTEDESSLPAELLTQLEAAGWQIKRNQRLLPVDLSDGRRLVVPVEELDLKYPEWVHF